MPSPEEAAITVPATLAAVRDLAAWMRGRCAEEGIDQVVACDLELALVEAANNIVEHGFQDRAGEIGLSMMLTGGAARLILLDRGPPAPAGLFEAAARTEDPLAEGGRGIAIMQACLDTIAYESAGGVNKLMLTRSLAG